MATLKNSDTKTTTSKAATTTSGKTTAVVKQEASSKALPANAPLRKTYAALLEAFDRTKKDMDDFIEKGNAAAGGRARAGMQSIRVNAATGRKQVQDIKNAEKKSAK